jgi:hypothetical protein
MDVSMKRAIHETAAFYAAHILPRAAALESIVRFGHDTIAAASIQDI